MLNAHVGCHKHGIFGKGVSKGSRSGRYIVDTCSERISERHDPWGTPAIGVLSTDKAEQTRTKYVLLKRNDCTSLTSGGDTFNWNNLCSRLSYHILLKSRNTADVLSFLFVVLARWSITFVSWLIKKCCGLRAYWSGWIEVGTTFIFWIRIMISITSAIELMSAMFRWLLRFLRSLPDFCIITTVAVFYGVGKYWYLRPQLNILVNARRVWSEKCWRAMLEIPSSPKAVLHDRHLIMFFTSFVVTD